MIVVVRQLWLKLEEKLLFLFHQLRVLFFHNMTAGMKPAAVSDTVTVEDERLCINIEFFRGK